MDRPLHGPIRALRASFPTPGQIMMIHSSRRVAGLLATGVAAIGMMTACSDEALAPLAPSAAALSASKGGPHGAGAVQTVTSDKKLAALRLSRPAFDKVAANWSQFKKSVEDGDVKAEPLRCEPKQRAYASRRIGAKGGRVTLGGHTIDIPAGALASDVEISMSVRPGPFMELEFAPHGLKFKKPVEITFNYGHCTVPANAPLDVVFVENGWRILENMPSSDVRGKKKMSTLTDHFSGYMMSTGRKGSVESDEM
jgi:hypothetical protein